MKRAAWLLVVLVPACATVLDIRDLVPGPVAPDGGSETNADGATDAFAGDAPATCTDTTTDTDCGRCGHSCLGGACIASRCQPVEIANGTGTVTGLAVNGTDVVFAAFSPDAIEKVAKTGGVPVPLASGGDVDIAKHIALSPTHVYWGNSDCCSSVVARVPLAGGAVQSLASAEEAIAVALDGDFVYWADRNADVVRRRLADGGGPVELIGLGEGASPMAVAVRDGSVFYLGDVSGGVRRANQPPDGGSVAIGSVGQSGRELALDATHVYWSAQIDPGEPGKIARAPRAGGTPTTIGAAGGEALGIAVDGDTIYWTAQATDAGAPAGGVYACNVNGCAGAPTVFATEQDLPRGIALDAEAIYWGTRGRIMKVARP